MRAVVLGGAGFLGRHLCDQLRRAGHAVTVYGRTASAFDLAGAAAECEVREIAGDVRDPVCLAHTVAGMDWVFHLAGNAQPHRSNLQPHQHMLDELNGLVNVLEVCVKAGVGKLLLASSGGTIYGVSESLLLDENHPTNPISSYGIAKLTAEKYLELYRQLHGLRCVILRIANPYGPGQQVHRGQGVIAAWMHRILTGQAVTLWGDGKQVRDFVYVGDVVEAFVAAAEAAPSRHAVFNIGAGAGTCLNELLPMLAKLTGRSVAVEYRPGRPWDVPRAVLDVRRAREHLGWQARTALSDGLARTWDWVQQIVESPAALHDGWLHRVAAA